MTAVERVQLVVIAVLLVLLLVAGVALAVVPPRADLNRWRDRAAKWKARAEAAEAEVARLARAGQRRTYAVPPRPDAVTAVLPKTAPAPVPRVRVDMEAS